MAYNAMQSFNARMEECEQRRTKDDYNCLHRSLSSLISNDGIHLLNAAQKEVIRFYVNLYNLLNELNDQNNFLLPACLDVIEAAIRNTDTRDFLTLKIKMVPLLGEVILLNNCTQEMLFKLYGLLQTLTDNSAILDDEPYFDWLIPHLIAILTVENMDTKLGKLSLSVLNNLCHQNDSAIQRLMHEIPSMDVFVKILEQLGLPGMRMFFLLGSIGQKSDENYNKGYLKVVLAQIPNSVRDFNEEVLCYMTAILNDGRDNEVIRSMIEQFDFASIVCSLIEQLENVLATSQAQILFIGRTLEMISALISLNKSLVPHYNPLLVFALKHIKVDGSMDTLRQIISDESVTIYNINELVLPKILELVHQLKYSTNNEATASSSIAFFRLLVVIHKRYPSTAILVTPSTFDYLLTPLVENEPTLDPYAMSSKQLAVYIHCMHVLVAVAAAANTSEQEDQLEAWREKLFQTFEARHMQHIIARASLSGSDLTQFVFELARCSFFPSFQISKIMKSFGTKVNSSQNRETLPKNNRCCELNRYTRIRLDDLIAHLVIKDNNTTNPRSNVSNEAVFNLLESKCRDHRIREQRMQEHLKIANRQITRLMHEQELILGENTRFNGQIYLNQLSIDHLTKVNADMREDAQRGVKTLTTLHRKYTISEAELQALTTKYNTTKTDLDAQIATMKIQIDADTIKLRKNKNELKIIPTLEDKCVGLEKKLIQSKDEGTKLRDENAQLLASKQQLEISLAEKVAKISKLTSDLEETTQIDQQLMFLMEKKKAKKN